MPTRARLQRVMKEYDEAGFPGSMGCTECSHRHWAIFPVAQHGHVVDSALQADGGTTPLENPAQDAERHRGERTRTPGSQGAKRTRAPELTQKQR